MGERGVAPVRAVPLTRGAAWGPVVAVQAPLSFWGGVDRHGTVVDVHHVDRGRSVTGAVLVLPGGRGSSSSSSVLAELIRAGRGPVAIVLGRSDPILALGALVADELYELAVPVVVVDAAGLEAVAGWGDARVVADAAGGSALVSPGRF